MTSSDPPGPPRAPVSSLRSVVRVLCMVRLAVLGFGALYGAIEGAPVAALFAAAFAVPFSLVPALTWETRGGMYSRSGVLLAADMAVTVAMMTLYFDTTLMTAYAAASVALWGLVTALGPALVMALPVALLLLAPVGMDEWNGLWWSGAAVLGVVAMAWGGGALGASLRAQDVAAAELAEEQLARASAAERMRLARDIHDSVTGDLAGLLLLTRELRDRLEHADVAEEDRELVRTVAEALAETHRRTRVTLMELRESAAEPAEAARGVVERWSLRTEIEVDLQIDQGISRLEPERWTQLQAILLELLENVRKHAEASRVRVELSRCGRGSVELVVADDGRGMPAELLRGDGTEVAEVMAHRGHFGLSSVLSRVAECGGHASWERATGGGTVARVTLGRVEPQPVISEGAYAHPDS